MHLLAPFKMCLQCLPIFSSESPPPSPRRPSPAGGDAKTESSAYPIGSSLPSASSNVSAPAEGEQPSFSDASLIHDGEQKDLPLSEPAKVQLGMQSATPSVHVAPQGYASKKDQGNSSHDAAQRPSKQEKSHSTDMSPHDADLSSTPETMPTLPPFVPTPVGLVHIVGPHAASHHIHHQIHSHHSEDHSLFHTQGSGSGHVENKTHSLSSSSHLTQKDDSGKVLSSGKDHASLPTFSSHSGKEHVGPLSGSSYSGKEHADLTSTSTSTSTCPPSELMHPHEQALQTSHSAPHLPADNVKYDVSMAAGTLSALETSHSEPMEDMGTGGRMRRRDHLKHHLKDLHGHLKQGGHLLKEEGGKHLQSIVHLKEEGSRHLHSMVNNISNQAQQMLEETGTFAVATRGNGNLQQ